MTQYSKADGPNALDNLSHQVVAFAADREWSKFHDPKNLTMAIASEAGELAAILRWTPTHEADGRSADSHIRERLLSEIGDVGILLLLLCERLGEDFVATVRAKLEINSKNYPVDESRGQAERSSQQNPGVRPI